MKHVKAPLVFFALLWCVNNAFALALNTAVQDNIINDLRHEKGFKSLNADDLRVMSQEIINSALPYEDLKLRLVRYRANGMLPFMALERAITLEKRSRLRKMLVKHVWEEDGPFLSSIKILNLLPHEEEKVVKAYATCIYPLQFEKFRGLLAPRVGDPVNHYSHTRHHENHDLRWRTKPAQYLDERVAAYNMLISNAQSVAGQHNLNDFEKVTMAKCLAEQAIRFFKPYRHPLSAAKESALLFLRSPEEAFFSEHGVCSNFVAITYCIAQELSLKSRLFVARRHMHSYLELEVNGTWYHTHPFSSNGYADFNRFGDISLQGDNVRTD